jgi:hypothetical protein
VIESLDLDAEMKQSFFVPNLKYLRTEIYKTGPGKYLSLQN